MNILVISQYFWPENFRINDLVKGLVSKGHTITVLTGLPNYPQNYLFEDYAKDPTSYDSYEGIKLIRVPMTLRGFSNLSLALNYISFAFSASIIGLFKVKKLPIDVILVFQPSPIFVAFPAILIGKVCRVPILLWVLDLWPDTLFVLNIVKKKILKYILSSCVRFIYDHCSVIVGQSPSFISGIRKYITKPVKTYLFANWPEDIFTLEEKVSPLKRVGLTGSSSAFKIMFAGNIGDAQDIESIILAAYELRNADVKWIFVGSGRKLEWLSKQVQEYKLHHRVTFLGNQPLEVMPNLYAQADALLVALKKNDVFSRTIPGKIQSYMAAGMPILGMLDGEGAGAIINANAGYVCNAGDYMGLAANVEKMLGLNKSDLTSLGNNGKRFAFEEFNREKQITLMESYLKIAIAGAAQ